jgi:hypothetical protein
MWQEIIMKLTKATLKRIIKEELEDIGEGEGQYMTKHFYTNKPIRYDDSSYHLEEAKALLEKNRKYYPKLLAMCDEDIILQELASDFEASGYGGPGSRPMSIPASVFEMALKE